MKTLKCYPKSYFLLFSILAVLVLYSCNKDNDLRSADAVGAFSEIRSEEFALSEDEKQEIFDSRQTFGELLRLTMIDDDNFRNALRNLFIETYSDNGGELLLAEILDRNVDESNTIESILLTKLESSTFTSANQDFLSSLAQNDPLLAIDIPIIEGVSNVDWTESYVPSVIVGNYEYNDNFETMKFINQENAVEGYDVTNLKQEMSLYIKTSELFVAFPNSETSSITGNPLHGFGSGDICEDLLQALESLDNIINHGSYEDWHIAKYDEFFNLYVAICINPENPGSGQGGGCEGEECDRDCDDRHEYLTKWKLETLDVFGDVRCGLQKTITINALPVYTNNGEFVFPNESVTYQKAFSRHVSKLIHCNFIQTSCVALWQYPPAEFAWGWRMYDDWQEEDFDKMFIVWTGFPDNAATTMWSFSLTGGYQVGSTSSGVTGSGTVSGSTTTTCSGNVHALGSGDVLYCDDTPKIRPTGSILYEQDIK